MKIGVLLANGFEEVESLTVVDYLRRAGLDAKLISTIGNLEVEGSHKIKVIADELLEDIEFKSYDAVVIPGGLPGSKALKENEEVLRFIRETFERKSLVTAICAGPVVLEAAGILEGRNLTSYPGFDDQLSGNYKEDKVVIDGNLITGRGPEIAVDFTLEILRYFKDDSAVDKLKAEILYRE